MRSAASLRSADTSRIVSIQYLRAAAAMLVIGHHALNVPALAPYYSKSFGTYGVDLFFVISGYIMWSTTANRRRGTLKFWGARVIRVVPLYWFFTTLFVGAALLFPVAVHTAALDPEHVLKSYLFIPAVHPGLGGALPVYTLGWTLNYEMFFYFVFGLCLLIPYRALQLTALVGILVFLVSVGHSSELRGAVALSYTNPVLLEFAAGAVLGSLAPWLYGLRSSIGWGLFGGAILWLLVAYSTKAAPIPIIAHGVPATAMLAGAVVLEPTARLRLFPIGLFLGDASYSLYLAHPFALRVWYYALDSTIGVTSVAAATMFAVLAVIVGIAAGAVSYLLVEKPMLRMARRLGRTAT